MLPDKIRQLGVSINGQSCGDLLKHAVFEFRYAHHTTDQPWVGLLMPPNRPTYQDGDLFPVMDQNLPEGDLFVRLRQLYPKQPLNAMHLLALSGSNGIGRLGFTLSDVPAPAQGRTLSKSELLHTKYTPELFDELVSAYLSTGAGIAGMQPKIMVPDRPTIPIPTLIVKAGSLSYPGLAANEFVCMSAAKRAGISTPTFDLSDDGQLFLVDRFDVDAQGQRLGFEDVASLMGLRVRDVLADRKYQGSYELVTDLLKTMGLGAQDLHRFFEQLAFSVMVGNGDAHLKNFALIYTNSADAQLSPMFDVVCTRIYRYARFAGGPDLEDNTMALKLFKGRHQTRTYPLTEELLNFGRQCCSVKNPQSVLDRIAQAMSETLSLAQHDERVPAQTLRAMQEVWAHGMAHGQG